jgi:flagellar protein FlaI
MVFEKIKNLRGLFYRKLTEKQKIEEVLPGFYVKKPKRIIEFPPMKDLTEINITYPLIEPFAYANIKWEPESKQLTYFVIEPKMTEEEVKLLKKISEALIELVDVELSAIKVGAKVIEYLEENILKVIKEFGLSLSQAQYIKIMYYVYRNFVGFNEIETFLQDPNIEDISCDGINSPVYVVHRKYGSIKTNIVFNNVDVLREFVVKLAERCGRYVSYAEPILSGTLPEGSRVSATLAGDVATRGPTFTIRKFGEKPLSPIEQVELNTASVEMLAYFWYLIEHGASMLIVGGTATGKTSFLNSVCMFIPPEAKIVSIEDTRELRFPHEHWIPGLARVGFGIPTPTGEKYGEVTLFDLLRESFRQNPDYVIVGETRGQEAYVMFQGMASGHASFSTFHAGSLDTVIKRLTSPPIELSPTLLESLHTVAVMVHSKEKGESARRVREIIEIESVDPKTEEVKTNIVFRWDPVNDTFEKVNDSIAIKKLILVKGISYEDVIKELTTRAKVLQWMSNKGIKDYLEVTKIINQYYKEPETVLKMIGEKVEIPVKVKVPETPKREEKAKRTSILELLGFRFIKEK